jgi:hypothetical protein
MRKMTTLFRFSIYFLQRREIRTLELGKGEESSSGHSERMGDSSFSTSVKTAMTTYMVHSKCDITVNNDILLDLSTYIHKFKL